MRIHCKLRDVFRTALSDHALDRCTGLALIEQDGLVIEDAPPIANVSVHPDRSLFLSLQFRSPKLVAKFPL
ncbi:hypothetical protein AWV80_11920 [Cupriavidus sp. UYMU48A]|nr:hypothetical protein AWV80_11920 [Cupriavidus sp. UYMU48A]